MIILLDLDGVLVTEPNWKPVEQLSDGFMKFNESTVENLAALIDETGASIILTTTHRIHFDENKWKEIFSFRGIHCSCITKLNNKQRMEQLGDRATEIKEWVEKLGKDKNYVIIDDDLSINGLNDDIKKRWVSTKPLIGFDKDAKAKALHILSTNKLLRDFPSLNH